SRGSRFTGPASDTAQIITRDNTNPLPGRDCGKAIAPSILEEFLTAAGSFFLTEPLCQPSTPGALSGTAKRRGDRAAPITNATRALSTNFVKPKARHSRGRTTTSP